MSVILPIEVPRSCLDCPCHDGEYGVCNLTMKTIDGVRPNDCPMQEVKHGTWIERGLENPKCSLCLRYAFVKNKYCPHCGAKMDGGDT